MSNGQISTGDELVTLVEAFIVRNGNHYSQCLSQFTEHEGGGDIYEALADAVFNTAEYDYVTVTQEVVDRDGNVVVDEYGHVLTITRNAELAAGMSELLVSGLDALRQAVAELPPLPNYVWIVYQQDQPGALPAPELEPA